MKRDDLIQFHSKRAMQELDMGLTAPSWEAAKAHLHLSALHMEQVRLHGERSERALLAVE